MRRWESDGMGLEYSETEKTENGELEGYKIQGDLPTIIIA